MPVPIEVEKNKSLHRRNLRDARKGPEGKLTRSVINQETRLQGVADKLPRLLQATRIDFTQLRLGKDMEAAKALRQLQHRIR